MNKLLALTPEEVARGVVTASTGNHGLAVAFGMQKLNIQGTIYLPETAAPNKIELLERQGANLSFYGKESAQTEVFAREEAGRSGRAFVSPYNDPHVVAGQGTIGAELLDQLPEIDAVFVPVGGGGLIGGIAKYLKSVKPDVRVIGCLPENSPVMYECIRAGKIVEGTVLPTLSDGTAGGVEEDAITFDLCRQLVDEWILVSEDEISDAMRLIFNEHALVIEGAAGVSVAACRKRQDVPEFKHAAVILCGGNVDMGQFKGIVCG